MKKLLVGRRFAGLALMFAMLTAIAGQPAFAVVPEIKLDPQTGDYIPHPELEVALVMIESSTTYAEFRWRRAPWFAS